MADKNVYISMVLPTYNMSRYLGDCVRSMRRQKFENWEAIFVDDGSSDDTLDQLKKFAAEDCRVRYVHQENGGVSKARNAGILAARGEWVWCIDPDDVLLSDSLERIVSLLAENDLEAVFFSELGPFEGAVDWGCLASGTFGVIDSGNDRGTRLLLQERIVWGHPFMRVLKRNLYRQCLYFEGTRYYEDSLQLIDTVCRVKHWAYIDAGVYGYRQREGSVCHGYKHGQCRGVMETVSKMIHRVRENNLLTKDQFRYYFNHVLRGALCWYFYRALSAGDVAERRSLRSDYGSLVEIVGWQFANKCLRLRLLVAECGMYDVLVKIIDAVEYLAGGVSARMHRLFK